MRHEEPVDSRKGRLRRIKALIIKETFQIFRDPSSVLISIVLPLVLLFLYGFGVSLDLDHVPIGLALEDTSPTARSFAQSLTDSRYFDVKIRRDRREFIHDILRGTLRGMVIVPSYFTAFKDRNNIAPIQVISDGSEPNTANFVQNYINFAWQNWLQQESISGNQKGLALVNLQPRFWFNEQLESRYFLVPGSLAIIMTLIGTLLTALVVSREWERGTMEAIMATPVSIWELLIGKLLPYFVLGMASMTICVVVGILLYDIPLRGSLLVLEFVAACFLLSALGLGLFISTVSKNQFVAAQASMVAAFLPAYILSGFIFEIASMPILIQWLTYLIPARYFVTSLQTLFLVGNIWSLIIANVIPMLVIGCMVFILTAFITAKRLD